ncbi:S1 family peptidase [Bradyrhizobium sp. 521_C7_N1_3]|uniref:S1 family peptidase n=1 Tax=Bradyrhizobium sp. 521_C7_N1_3 TaxID=3240368 RepID=UPI003F88B2A9
MATPKDDSQVAPEKTPVRNRQLLDTLEQISRISVPLLIPIVVALIGYFGNEILNSRQGEIEKKKIDLEYVKIAKDVASNVTPDANTLITNWAYRVLFKLSPVSVPDEDVEILSKQRVPLPSSVSPAILGGTGTSVAEWPWLVSVFEDGTFICNGTVIAPKAVLSAANCMSGERRGKFEVATATDNGPNVRIGRRIPVTKFVVHPTYSEDTARDDIAILEIGTALPPPFITIATQKSADPRIGELTLVAGFDFKSQPASLLQSPVPIANAAMCAAMYPGKVMPEGTFCAGFEHGGAVACAHRGAGGPAVLLNSAGRKYQVGIVSLGEDCNSPKAGLGVYTRVSSYADWIRKGVPNLPGEQVTGDKR